VKHVDGGRRSRLDRRSSCQGFYMTRLLEAPSLSDRHEPHPGPKPSGLHASLSARAARSRPAGPAHRHDRRLRRLPERLRFFISAPRRRHPASTAVGSDQVRLRTQPEPGPRKEATMSRALTAARHVPRSGPDPPARCGPPGAGPRPPVPELAGGGRFRRRCVVQSSADLAARRPRRRYTPPLGRHGDRIRVSLLFAGIRSGPIRYTPGGENCQQERAWPRPSGRQRRWSSRSRRA
jgi:hypothetical protein